MGRGILIVAGEASGDAQAAELAAALRRRDRSVDLYGVGGPHMRAAGVQTIIDASDLSVMGFAELAGGLTRVWRSYRRVVHEIRNRRPALVVLVDFPDFNLRLARVAKSAGIPVFYYVSPQVWAWRRGRVRKIARRVDRMVVLFPFEVEFYRRYGVDARFVGHPLAETVRATSTREATRERYGLPAQKPAVALLPGSRAKEVRVMLPLMLDAVERLGEDVSCAVACAPGLEPGLVRSLCDRRGRRVAVAEGDTYNLIAASDAVAVTSGTATVECALLGAPMVVVYRMSPFSYAIARSLVRVPFIAMPNLLLSRLVVPELIQKEATAENLADRLRRYLEDAELRARVAADLGEVRRMLVQPGAADRAAEAAWELVA